MPPDITLPLVQIKANALNRLPGYVDEVLRVGQINGDQITLSPEEFTRIRETFTPPTPARMVRTAARSIVHWAKKGAQRTSPETLEIRKGICAGCEFWDSAALQGTGRCRKCGCSTWAKLRMATEKCPIDKWGPEQPAPEGVSHTTDIA